MTLALGSPLMVLLHSRARVSRMAFARVFSRPVFLSSSLAVRHHPLPRFTLPTRLVSHFTTAARKALQPGEVPSMKEGEGSVPPLPSSSPQAPLPPVAAEEATPRAGVLGYFDKVRVETRRLFVNYGWLAGGAYFGVWACTMTSVYGALELGLLPSPDVNAFLNSLSLKAALYGPEPITVPEWGKQLATAWVITKTTEPVRLFVVLGLVPVLVKRLPASVLKLFRVDPLSKRKV